MTGWRGFGIFRNRKSEEMAREQKRSEKKERSGEIRYFLITNGRKPVTSGITASLEQTCLLIDTYGSGMTHCMGVILHNVYGMPALAQLDNGVRIDATFYTEIVTV